MNIIGVDVGGTFTDLLLVSSDRQEYLVHKVPSVPGHQEIGVINGIRELLENTNTRPDEVGLVIHGTTVATNAMLERKGARVVLVTTAGFEDVIEIGRQNRTEIYDIYAQRTEPLVGRDDRIGVTERIGADGSVITELSETEIERTARLVDDRRPQAIAISLLFSFLNERHEMALLRRLWSPTRYTVASFEVLPEFREYERTSTTVMEAYLGPLVISYLERLNSAIKSLCPRATLAVMQSNGGTMIADRARGNAVRLAISGLAGGVIGGWTVARNTGLNDVITLDMGGTSCDISAIRDCITIRSDNEVAGLPLRTPSVDVKTIGAGGGSIAWIDDAGVMHVGPQSAGADPGPAAYDKGGRDATITDADLVVGRLNPDYFLGGRVRLNMARARESIEQLADRLGLSALDVAIGMIQISTSNMVQAIREVTIERGHDPRSATLVPFGGAGPTHATDIADALNIRTILIPPHPGITSAFGLVCADLRVDRMRSVLISDTDVAEFNRLTNTLHSLTENVREELMQQGAIPTSIDIRWEIDMRYLGQSHELTIEVPVGESDLRETSRLRFERRHEEQYGYCLPGRAVEWVTARVVGTSRWKSTQKFKTDIRDVELRAVSTRAVYISPEHEEYVQVYRRDEIPVDVVIQGPAIVEQFDTTTYIGPQWTGQRRLDGTLMLRREEEH